jgi:hypothetical protein
MLRKLLVTYPTCNAEIGRWQCCRLRPIYFFLSRCGSSFQSLVSSFHTLSAIQPQHLKIKLNLQNEMPCWVGKWWAA